MSTEKHERLRFTVNDDLILLREVTASNPYHDVNLWKDIHVNTVAATGKNFSLRTIKDRVNLLLKLWRKSSDVEQYEEKKQLLQSLSHMANEFKARKESNVSAKCEARKGELEVRDGALPSIIVLESAVNMPSCDVTVVDESSSLSCPRSVNSSEGREPHMNSSDQVRTHLQESCYAEQPNNGRKRRCRESTLKSSSLQFLYSKQEAEQHAKNRELDIEERKLDLEQKKIELEERKLRLEEIKWKTEERERQAMLDTELRERKQRLEIDIEERRQRLHQAEQQQKLTELLFQLIRKT